MTFKQYIYKNQLTDYLINEFGDVYSKKTNKILKSCMNISGRNTVCLQINKKQVVLAVYRMVYETFIGEIPPDMTVDHINENKLDDALKNLQLLSIADNVKKSLSKYNNNFKKEVPDSVIEKICAMLKEGTYYRLVADIFSLNYEYVYNIVHGKRRKNIVKKYLPFPISSYQREGRRNNIILKHELEILIKEGKSNYDIKRILDFNSDNSANKLIQRMRKRLNIKDPRYLSDIFIKDVKSKILEGLNNKQILVELDIERTQQITYLLARLRKKLNKPDIPDNILDNHIKSSIVKDIKNGLSNKDILKKYNLEYNNYMKNLFGALRYKIKNKKDIRFNDYRKDILYRNI